MREITFTRLNQGRWKEAENHLSKKKIQDPELLSELYLQLSDDLSYANTYYPNSKTSAYLNTLVLKIHQQLHTAPKYNAQMLRDFFLVDYPLLLSKHLKFLLISTVVFLISCIIGAFSAANDQEYVRLILGDAYVNQTLSNIENGTPLAVYSSFNEIPMFFMITLNNIRVALLAFGSGITAGVGTGYILFQNGIMLGAFQYFFAEQNVLLDSVAGIWMHGSIEIFSIVISGAGGLVMGSSMIFPKSYPRLYSFQQGAIDGVKITMGLIPLFVIAGFIESFLTRHSTTQWLSIGVISCSILFILFYFFIYPQIVKKNYGSITKP